LLPFHFPRQHEDQVCGLWNIVPRKAFKQPL
jgi:hypothetical protein